MAAQRSSKFLTTILLLGGAAPLGYPYWPFNFNGFSICDTCGVTRSRRERQLPLLDTTWRTTHGSEHDTPLSRLLQEFDRVPQHEHTWQFVRGAGNGTQCAIGRGQYLYETAQDERIVEFLRFLKKRESSEYLDSWISFALDHRTTLRCRSMMWRLERYPDREQAWWNERRSMDESREEAAQEAARYPRY